MLLGSSVCFRAVHFHFMAIRTTSMLMPSLLCTLALFRARSCLARMSPLIFASVSTSFISLARESITLLHRLTSLDDLSSTFVILIFCEISSCSMARGESMMHTVSVDLLSSQLLFMPLEQDEEDVPDVPDVEVEGDEDEHVILILS